MITFKQFLTEASEGPAKWEKYFGDEDVDTIVKADTIAFDLAGSPTDVVLSRGEPIKVLAGEYDSKPIVRAGKKRLRIKLKDIEKPFKKNQTIAGQLKPDQLGLFNAVKMTDLSKKIKQAIAKHDELPEPHAAYLKALVDHAENPSDEKKAQVVRDLYIMSGVEADVSFKATVNNDFMEVLGPFFVVNEKPQYKAGGAKFPEAGNEPLYDFTMKPVTGEAQIDSFSSKKSGGNTNTLKVAEILKTATSDAKLRRKYKLELELLHIINDNPLKLTPNLINDWLKKTFPRYKKAPKSVDDASISALERSVVKWINEQSDLDFTPLVKMSIPDLWYVRARLNTDGTLKVEPLKSGRELGDVKLRGKSSPNHLSDKIGFAV